MLRQPQMLTSSVRLLLLMLLVAALALPAVAEPARVENGPTPRDGIDQLELEEIWRHGGEDDEDVLFGLVSSVITDADGLLYVLDSQLAQVNVFSPDGELVEIIELPGHPFFLAVQFHPELKSRPNRPHPIFEAFVAAAVTHQTSSRDAAAMGG